jgi:hypothetical protein
MSDAQYDLTLASYSDDELELWEATIRRGMARARDRGEESSPLEERLADIAVELERRELVASEEST